MNWRHIKSAPKDGTSILLAEVTPEWSNVMEGRWCTHYGPMDNDAPKRDPRWWGVNIRGGFSRWSGGPYGRAEMVAISPRYWKPMDVAPKYRKERDRDDGETP